MDEEGARKVPLVVYTKQGRKVIGEATLYDNGLVEATIEEDQAKNLLGQIDMRYSLRPPTEYERLEIVPHISFRKKYYTDEEAIAEAERAAKKPWEFNQEGDPK